MRVLVSSHDRFCITPDGTLWAPAPAAAYSFWTRYLERFSEVGICARAKEVEVPPEGWPRATGPSVKALPLPSFLGPLQFAKTYPRLVRASARVVKEAQAIILRGPSDIAGLLFDRMPRGRPFGLEVMGDPLESLGAGSIRHPLQPLLRRRAFNQLRSEAAAAVAVSYVSRTALPERYPAAPAAFVTNYSSIHLPRSDFATAPRPESAFARQPLRLVCVGTFEQLYKGQDLLLTALKTLHAEGFALHTSFAGGGRYLADMQRLANELGVTEHVTFLGHVAGRQRVLELMDASDLLVLPSRTEGLPRVVIEAQARGLPCIGARVGGVPELLEEAALFEPGSVSSLVQCLRSQLAETANLARASRNGLRVAEDYEESVLSKRRKALYDRVASDTTRWLGGDVR